MASSAGPIFIVGCPRSGTSLLRAMLRAHPRLAFPPESHFIPSFFRAFGDPRSDAEARALGRRILEHRFVRGWGVPLRAEDFAPDRGFAAVVERLYGAWARQRGRARWGDKTPHYVLDIPTLLDLFPGARILHAVRDGRDVAASWVQEWFGPGHVYVAAREWRRMVRAGRAAAAQAAGSVMEVRFEALLASPERVARGVCAFVGEEYTPSLLEPDPRDNLTQPPGTRGIVRDNTGRWVERLSRSERGIVESVAGDLLVELGYPLEGLARRLGRAEVAAWRLHHAVRWAGARLARRDRVRMLRDYGVGLRRRG